VSEILAAEKPLPLPPKVTFLPRIRTGEESCNVVGAAHMYHQDYDLPAGQDEVAEMRWSDASPLMGIRPRWPL
jgi:hypothetical protein